MSCTYQQMQQNLRAAKRSSFQLTESQVREVRRLRDSGSFSNKALCQVFGLSYKELKHV